MSKRDFYNLEDEITAKVKDALKAIDVANIKRDFNYKVFKENNAIEYQRARASISLTTGRLR